MDKRQKQAVKRYSEIVSSETNLAITVGRPESSLDLTEDIFDDIVKKLNIKNNDKILDIGCGYGELTKYILNVANEKSLHLTLLDLDVVLDKIKSNFSDLLPDNIKFISGTFPVSDRSSDFFDRILIYSVLHYTDKPEDIVEHAVGMLAPGGELLIGDIPNVNKKGRFVSTKFGRKFDANYHGISIESTPSYKDHHDYFDRCDNQNKKICDDLLLKIFRKYRNKGYDVFVLPQNYKLPFSLTREDLLIKAPRE